MLNKSKMNYNLKAIVVVFDQVIYVKAIEICWKHPTLYPNVILQMDLFLTIGVLLEIIGNRFGEARLRDIIIESNVIEEGSVKKVRSGKHYNRGVRFHKLFFEACMHLLWEGSIFWFQEKEAIQNCLDDLQSEMESLSGDLDPSKFVDIMNSHCLDVHSGKVTGNFI